ncbi:angiopoietin-1 receptor-like, partial [Dendronephthya gigantea]|uniref:angiopoietin-1 receptor-like n=1 Tax=Dendronephthya gigantea TaxID=151771 RepID=UPI00106C3B4D
TNQKRFKLTIKLMNAEFSNKLKDPNSSQYKSLKSKLEDSINGVYRKSTRIKLWYIGASITEFRAGSIVAEMIISLDSQFSLPPDVIVEELNKEEYLAGYQLDMAFTSVKDFDECKNTETNFCHEYAHCINVVGTYICDCFEGFFGDGKICEGQPQIIARSPENITQLVETNLTLVCTVIGNPEPIISWKRSKEQNGVFTEIERTSSKFGGNYSIHWAKIEDSGVYLCNSSNRLGWQSYTTKVRINPVIVGVDVEIQLSNKTFNEELKNKSSFAYKELEKDVYVELFHFFNTTPAFKDVEILGFVKGSVKVIFRVVMKVFKPSKITNDVVAVNLGRKINKQLKTGRIGNIQVVPEVLKLRVPPPPPANVTYSDVRQTSVHISWDPPELYEMFSIERYHIAYSTYGAVSWSNKTVYGDLTNIRLENLKRDTFYVVKIIAENAYGMGRESKRSEIKTDEAEDALPWHILVPVIVLAGLLFMVLAIFLAKRAYPRQNRTWNLKEDGASRLSAQKASIEMMESRKQRRNKSTYVNNAFLCAPTSSTWKELPSTSIEISDETIISEHFGTKVVRGMFSTPPEENRMECCIKILNESATEDDRVDLKKELRTISSVDCHENIVNLIGASTSEDGPLLLVLESCSRGTLESNLRDSDKNNQMLMQKKTICLANEIAKGMAHLTDAGVIHRDLAARTVLLTEDFTPKISNFGVPETVHERDPNRKITSRNLPARWLAIESLTDGLYTTKSDVWSFAVVMWEIESKGCVPYLEFEVTDLVRQINEGYRLLKPEDTSDETYELMLQCWKASPDLRPTFEEIVDTLKGEFL